MERLVNIDFRERAMGAALPSSHRQSSILQGLPHGIGNLAIIRPTDYQALPVA
jgi:hypothetical protein